MTEPALPPVRVEANARERIRRARGAQRRIAVLDDDPTGSQTVHDVTVVTDTGALVTALAEPGSCCFILTNTRSLDEPAAVAANTDVGRVLFERLDGSVDVISRSDSTLRGHVIAEVCALDRVRRQVLGRGFDGVLLVPAYLEAGRFTVGDVHWARVAGEPRPVGETEFARDATFGFSASNLREFVAEVSRGRIRADQVRSITLDDIRLGGPQRVAEVLAGVTDLTFVVVNAVDYADLDIVVLGLLDAEASGKAFLYRTGPSFPQALAASFMLDDRGPRMVHATDDVNSALDIFVKDMGLVTDAARANGFAVPLASAAEQLYVAGRRAGLGRRDDSSVIEVLRRQS